MEEEQIFQIGKLVYMKLFDNNGEEDFNKYQIFRDEKGRDNECCRIFWRFYIINN